MGLDFVLRKSFRKTWNRSVNVLAGADLLSVTPDWSHRRVNANCTGQAPLEVGERLLVSIDDASHVVVSRGLSAVAVLTSPPADVLEALRASCSGGLAYATVETVRPISNTVELTVEIPPPVPPER
jgi:hypothetical protein